MPDKPARITLDLPNAQALALAQMVRRFCWKDAVRFANPHAGGRERDALLEGTMSPQRTLAEAGYSPR